MFNPNLTTESALARIGTFKRSAEWRLDAGVDLIRQIQETGDEALATLVQAGHLTVERHSTPHQPITETGKLFLRRRADVANELFAQLMERFADFEDYNAFLINIVEEMLHNAIEHGTNYCFQGKVRVWSQEGCQGGLFGIDQTPSSVLASTLQARTKLDAFLHPHPYLGETGRGFWKAAERQDIEVNFEDIFGGLRTLIFSSLK